MQALQWTNKKLSLQEILKPEEDNSESLIKITHAGICNTDLEITKGYFDFNGTLGHEFVGIVEESSDPDWLGKRVVCDINCACYECETCESGNPHHCPNRTVIGIVKKDGAFAQYINVPTQNLYQVPDGVSNEKAVFAEPVAAALEIQEQVPQYKNSPVCVLGDGKLGLLIAMSLTHSGYDVTLVGRHPERLSRMGDCSSQYATHAVKDIYPLVIEATGNPEGLKTAIDIVKPKGTIILKSTYAKPFDFNPAMLVVNEINLVGSRCGPMDKAVDLLSQQDFDPTTLIDNTFSLTDGSQAFQQANKKGTLKILLEIS